MQVNALSLTQVSHEQVARASDRRVRDDGLNCDERNFGGAHILRGALRGQGKMVGNRR